MIGCRCAPHAFWFMLIPLLATVVAVGCATVPSSPQTSTVRAVGSDTMLPLLQRWAEEFMASHPRVSIYVEGGGTGAGVRALVRGRAEICAASRPLAPEEVQALFERHQTLGVRFLCALDALSVYVHPDNPVTDLSLEQLRAVFSGEVTSWDQLGGPSLPIHVLVRPPTSGTHWFFQDHVLGGVPYTPNAQVLPTTAAITARIHADPQAIGYGGLAYAPGLTHCRLEGAAPTVAAARDQSYPLARYLQLYTVQPPRGTTKELIDWILGPEGQRVVEEVGYIPLWRREEMLHAPFTPAP